MNNKNLQKGGPGPISLWGEHSFIAILLAPGIFLIQIFNTNMYLINFHSKNNIKMLFPKSWIFSFKPTTGKGPSQWVK